MKKGDVINGYLILEDFSVVGGMSKISFAEKYGKEYFIKEFLSPKYPTPDSPGSEKVKAQKRKECENFERHHLELNKKISSKCSLGGNLVYAVDFFRVGACYYKVNEKVDVSSLSCKDISRLPLNNILLVAKTVCHSLKILHELNIVHGDLKPDNILIKETSKGGFSGKLIDFDDSYFSGNPPKDREAVVGTPEYYSPELAAYIMDEDEELSGEILTCKSDIFTLGIILCEYFTGKKPTFDSSYGNIWKCVSKGGKLSFDSIPPRISWLINEMLNNDASKRPTIKQVFDVLKEKDVLEFAVEIKETPMKGSLLKGDLINNAKSRKDTSTEGGILKINMK